jgi:hypothetical protein
MLVIILMALGMWLVASLAIGLLIGRIIRTGNPDEENSRRDD